MKIPKPSALAAAIRIVLPWVPAALATLYAKYSWFEKGAFWHGFGEIKMTSLWDFDPDSLTVLEKATIYREDLLLAFWVVPFFLFVLLRWLPAWAQAWFVAPLSIVVIAFLYFQRTAYRHVGAFVSLEAMRTALDWGLYRGEEVWRYVSLVGLARVAGVSGLVIFLAASIYHEKLLKPVLASRRSRAVLIGSYGLLAGLTAIAWLPWMSTTSFHSSMYTLVLRPTIGTALRTQRPVEQLSAPELRARYRSLTGAPEPKKEPDYWAAAADSDLIMMVLETAPARLLDPEGGLDDLPNLRRLRERSWVALRHQTTYPLSADAVFSLLSSVYPVELGNLLEQQHCSLPGLIQGLRESGYETALFLPSKPATPIELPMWKALGFEQAHLDSSSDGAFAVRPWRKRLEYDRAFLDRLKKDVGGWLERGQRFAALLYPQIGHARWDDIIDDGQERDLTTRGKNILALQDQWLGEILDLLAEAGRVDHTLIVVTGDHGIRNRREDPSLRTGRLNEYTFGVPLFLHAPQALTSTRYIRWVTSHVDVSPSLLDLLGVRTGRRLEQGTAIWDERLKDRTTFFLGGDVLGVDGYHEAGWFYMRNLLFHRVFSNDRMEFDEPKLEPSDSPTYRRVYETIEQMIELQRSWGAAILAQGQPRP